ncbi:MAG: CidA/LrgA family protein [Bacteroides sp.]|nr:CidA/LrgA family protein [Bacteroides sp.]MCM1413181.1 CidA/LrgA family protein [Bacteroides sp.]MCM1472077.1 CidA/LrgA family protein [Bacteroides sp.]
MILQLAILFAFLALGELVVYITHIPIPSSIIGMVLLTLALKYRVVRLEWVATMSDFLVRNIGFFFVPAGIGVMRCFNLISEQWLPIVGASIISTFLIIATTGQVHQAVRRIQARRHRRLRQLQSQKTT